MGTVSQLGYLGLEVKDLAAWERFGTEVLGLTVGARFEAGFTLRMDGHAARFFVHQGPLDDVAYVGWEVADQEALALALARLRGASVEVTEASKEDAAKRHVERLVRFVDPGGMPSEIFFGPGHGEKPFESELVRSGFVADELGLGHVVLSARSKEESRAFYEGVLGFRLSDHIIADIHGYHADMAFLHTNARHHSVAFGGPQRRRIHHFMLEVRSMDDVGLAFDRAMAGGIRIMQTLGRHPNDRMFSFYGRTPSGFQFELGWGGREVDDATWQPTTYHALSEWGHHPPEFLVPAPRPAAPAPGKS